MKKRILLLEDDHILAETIEELLEMEGYIVSVTHDGDEASILSYEEKFDLYIFDINVPEIDGFDLLESLRNAQDETPTIFISAMTGMEEIAKAYELGCYDYLKKPFHLPQLLLHIQKIDQLLGIRDKQHIRLSQRYSFDKASETLLFDKKPVPLTKRQMQIVKLLATHQGNVVDFEMLRHYVWDDAIIDNATIRAEVSRLKKGLKEDFIVNIRGVGYRIDRN